MAFRRAEGEVVDDTTGAEDWVVGGNGTVAFVVGLACVLFS